VTQYFTIERIKQAIVHLENYSSKWVLIPLVFAVNGIDNQRLVNPNEGNNAGTDRFLSQYFGGNLIGLPDLNTGNAIRPKFSDVQNKPADFIAHQSINLWGNNYSSRGYREMEDVVEKDGRGSGTSYRLKTDFWREWEDNLDSSFNFEELLVWLYAFSGFDDSVNSWHDLFVNFQEQHLGTGSTFPQEYLIRFHVNNSVPWPDNILAVRPSDEDFRRSLLPSEYVAPGVSRQFPDVVGEFQDAIFESGVRFGDYHDEFVTRFLVSLVTKPFIILTGLSGSGKTQIALKFGEWLGKANHLLVAVRPDWTSGDALFGYENALDMGTSPSWFVPDVLEFMLAAHNNSDDPFVLILDEMNLAHVERYFGDFLSGIESRKPVIPNLSLTDGSWRSKSPKQPYIPIPDNLYVIGTVNVDETTYMFSPKVLDRANTLEFKVQADDLDYNLKRPQSIEQGNQGSLRTLLALTRDRDWQLNNAPNGVEEFADSLRDLHRILSIGGFEFGHRVFFEAIRFYAFFEETGHLEYTDALDIQIYQKILPRLHGSQRKLGPTLRRIAAFCFNPDNLEAITEDFDPEQNSIEQARLPRSYQKLLKMHGNLMINQFTSFTE